MKRKPMRCSYKRLLSRSARYPHDGSNTGSQCFTRCFARCFQKRRVLHIRERAPFFRRVLSREQRGSPCVGHWGTAHPGSLPSPGHLSLLRGAPRSETQEMLPAVTTPSRSWGLSEPPGAPAWQKPPSPGAEKLLNALPLCAFHQFNSIQLSQPPFSAFPAS